MLTQAVTYFLFGISTAGLLPHPNCSFVKYATKNERNRDVRRNVGDLFFNILHCGLWNGYGNRSRLKSQEQTTDETEQLIKMGLKVYLVNKIVDDLGKEHRHQNSHHDKQDGADS